jgi:peptide/nickel transport system substrate-binding protein
MILITSSVYAEKHGGEMKIKTNIMPLTLNPIHSTNRTEKTINRQIFDTLLVFNSKGEINNNLTTSWEINDDSTIFSFNLKENIYFQPYQINGKEVPLKEREVTAADWKWSFEYLSDPLNKSPHAKILKKVIGYDEYQQQKTDQIKGIKVLGKYQLEIHLEGSYAPFINNLTREAAVVMTKKAILNSDPKFSLKPVGTGPFKLDKFMNDFVKLTKYENYWKKGENQADLPYLNNIEFHFEQSNKLNENYKNFDLYQLNREQLVDFYHNKNIDNDYSLEKIADHNIFYVALNYDSKLNNNLNIKEAKALLRSNLERNNFINNYNLNNFSYLENPNNSLDILTKINNSNYQSTSAKANEINNQVLNLAINNSDLSLKTANLIRNELKPININLNIKSYSWANYLSSLENNIKSNIFIMSYDYQNKFDFIADNFYSESKKNYYNYQNSRIDTLVDYIKLTKDLNNQNRAYKIIEEILVNENPYLVLFQAADNYLVNSNLINTDIFKNIYTRDNLELLYFE